MSRSPVSTVWIALPLLLCIHIRVQAAEDPEPQNRTSTLATQTALLTDQPRSTALSAAELAENSQKRAHVEQLMEMTHALAVGQQMGKVLITIMAQAIKDAHPSIPDKVIDALPDTVDGVVADHLADLKERMVELYAANFTDADLVAMIQFYETPVGRKAVRLMPSIAQQATAIGMQWGRALGPEIEHRLNARFEKDGVHL